MRIETVRMTTDWLKNTSFGLNHYIPLVPRDGGDPAPPPIADWTPETGPATVAIFNEVDHLWVIDKKDPPALPAIYITAQSPIEMEGEPSPDGQLRQSIAPVIVMVGYINANSDSVAAKRDGEYTLRAVLRSLRELMRNAQAETGRTRNGVLLEIMEDPAIYFPIVEVIGQSRVSGAIGINFKVRDANPSFT